MQLEFCTATSSEAKEVSDKAKEELLNPSRRKYMRGSSIVIGGFNCPTCKLGFKLRRNLFEHLNRMVQIIRAECSKCSQAVFYNKCSFWIHAQEHKQLSPDYSKIYLAHIPRSLTLTQLFDTKPDMLIACKSCALVFLTWQSLESHLTQDRPTQACPLCHLVCPSICSLDIHKQIHSKKSPFTCPECGIGSFKDFDTLEYHCKMRCFHTARKVCFRCDLCGTLFSNRDTLHSHIASAHLEPIYFCQDPVKYFHSVEEYKEHKRVHGCSFNLTFCCPFCKSLLSSVKFFATHIKEHLSVPNVAKGLGLQCLQCDQFFITKQSLRQHLASAHSFLTCKYCCNIFETEAMLSCHQDNCIAKQCQSCTEDALNGGDLLAHGQSHLEEHHWVCLFCSNQEFPSRYKLLEHFDYHTQELYPHFCNHCNQNYRNKNHLMIHLMILHHCMGLKCHRCKEKFSSVKHLESHLLTEGHAMQMYCCEVCGKFGSAYIQDVLRHIVEKHQVFEQGRIKESFTTRWFGLSSTPNSQCLPPLPFPPSTHKAIATSEPLAIDDNPNMPKNLNMSMLRDLGLVEASYCPPCRENFAAPSDFLAHQQTFHQEVRPSMSDTAP